MRLFPLVFRRRARRGSVYLLVIGMSALVFVSALAALLVVRTQTRTFSMGNDSVQAEALAQSAVEYALANLNANASWRTTYTNGIATTPISFSGGTISFKLVDETDANLSDSATEPIRIYGIGCYGKATRIYSVQANGKDALTCLNAPVVIGGDIQFLGSVDAAGVTLAANGSIQGLLGTVNANLEAGGSINPGFGSFTGTNKSGVTPRSLPASTVFDSYIAAGTSIPYSALNADPSGGRMLSSCVLSPGNNPFGGGLNAQGIYVIDCQSQVISIGNCRIVGTLVVLNPASGSRVGNGNGEPVNWEPAVTNYPCLLVKGTISFEFGQNNTAMLLESNVSTNFNPANTPYPYPNGTSNTTTNDSYPCRIHGLVYVSGTAQASATNPWYTPIDMLVAGGSYGVPLGGIKPVYNSQYTTYPPPGFDGLGKMVPVRGTWRWEPAP